MIDNRVSIKRGDHWRNEGFFWLGKKLKKKIHTRAHHGAMRLERTTETPRERLLTRHCRAARRADHWTTRSVGHTHETSTNTGRRQLTTDDWRQFGPARRRFWNISNSNSNNIIIIIISCNIKRDGTKENLVTIILLYCNHCSVRNLTVRPPSARWIGTQLTFRRCQRPGGRTVLSCRLTAGTFAAAAADNTAATIR